MDSGQPKSKVGKTKYKFRRKREKYADVTVTNFQKRRKKTLPSKTIHMVMIRRSGFLSFVSCRILSDLAIAPSPYFYELAHSMPANYWDGPKTTAGARPLLF